MKIQRTENTFLIQKKEVTRSKLDKGKKLGENKIAN